MRFKPVNLFSSLLLSLIILLSSSSVSSAQDSAIEVPPSTEELVDFSAVLSPTPVRIDEKPRLVIKLQLKDDWHIYSVTPSKEEDAPPPTKVTIHPDYFINDGPTYETRPIKIREEALGINLYYHEHRAEIYRNLLLREDLGPGQYSATARIRFQLCTDKICLPAEVREVPFSFRVEKGEPREEYAFADRSINPLPLRSSPSDLSSMLSEGFWAFIALAALMGLASLLTPCVFPMIPITVSFFSKQAEGKQSRVIKLALIFSAGIIVTYTGVGLLLSALFGAGSAIVVASNPIVNLVIALVFIVFAFSLMGAFNISLPAGIENYFDRKSRKAGGTTGVLLMGFTFTLTAFTCTVQFVGTMLIAAAQGEWIWPLIGMLVFSTVFAFPFFLLAVAPSLIRQMQQKTGEWLGRSKFILGILELMASVKFLSNADLVWQTHLISRNTAIVIWITLLFFGVLYLIWTGVKPKLNKSPGQWGAVVVLLLLMAYIASGWNGHSLGSLIDAVLPPPSGFRIISEDFVTEEEAHSVVWYDSLEEAKRVARQEGKKIFLEFTGYTCVNCRWMEQKVLVLKSVHNTLKDNYVLVKLFTDGGENARQNLQLQIDRFNTVALPFYVILTEEGEYIRHFSGISLNPELFLDFLND